MKKIKFKNLIIILIFTVIGFVLGYMFNVFMNKTKQEDVPNVNLTDISYTDDIMQSEYNNTVVEGYVTELQNLIKRMQELNSEKSDIESKILDIKHKLNNSTNFTYEQQIYPENTNNK